MYVKNNFKYFNKNKCDNYIYISVIDYKFG